MKIVSPYIPLNILILIIKRTGQIWNVPCHFIFYAIMLRPAIRPRIHQGILPVLHLLIQPSILPIIQPIIRPTIRPILHQTTQPIIRPIIHQRILPFPPSSNPTNYPTDPPSSNPTNNPSNDPTNNPTDRPSNNPTNYPTNNPSSNPTNNPSEPPSSNPTNIPTYAPSFNPTFQPTMSPTHNPSMPTFRPSNNPTYAPSTNPTNTPTIYPTNSPSTPTFMPSINPTNPPSLDPTDSPSYVPSSSPTTAPTATTTFSPTLPPSDQPTDATSAPSSVPTKSPSSVTLAPTKIPSSDPTESPSYPTIPPSTYPSQYPSRDPTYPPSTHQPSNMPVMSPTIATSTPTTSTPTTAPTISFSGSAVWSSSFLSVFIDIDTTGIISDTSSLVNDCSAIFDTETLKQIDGNKAVCTWTHGENIAIVVQLPSTATLNLTHNKITIKPGAFSFKMAMGGTQYTLNAFIDILSINMPQAISTPHIITNVQPVIGLCDDLVLDARSTTNLGGRDNAYFEWFIYGLNITKEGSFVIIPSAQIAALMNDITVQLTVTNWYDATSSSVLHIYKSMLEFVPQIDLNGISEYSQANDKLLNGQIGIYSSIIFGNDCDDRPIELQSDEYSIQWFVQIIKENENDVIDADILRALNTYLSFQSGQTSITID
eukprot:590331_1